MTITEFINARIDEDEEAARLGAGHPAYPHYGDTAAEESVQMAKSEGCAEAGYRHLRRWLPARVLAECEAKRRIVEEHPIRWQKVDRPRRVSEQEVRTEIVGGPFIDDELRVIASIYADHPDYDTAWRL